MLRRPLFALAACAILTLVPLASPAHADDKPAFDFKAKRYEIKIIFDEAIKADAPLADALMKDGKRWAERNNYEAQRAQKKEPELFRDGMNWSFERSYATESVVADRYVSIIRTEYTFTGGAHPNTAIETLLWDRTEKRFVSIRRFFRETDDDGTTMSALRQNVIAALTAEKKERGTLDNGMDWQKDIAPKLIGIGPVTLAPSTEAGKSSGLLFSYGPYEVGAYAEGSYQAFVPYKTFAQFLSPEGEAIFTGTRPAPKKDDR